MISPVHYKDAYKLGHKDQYTPGTEFVYSNFTARYSRLPGVNHYVVFGVQYFVKDYLQRRFNDGFFKRPLEEVVAKYQRRVNGILGPNTVGTEHIAALHRLGYLPIKLKALPEGTLCPIRVPCLTIQNTLPEFYWLTNFLETLLSNVLWHPMTSATIAHTYRRLLEKFAAETSCMPDFVQWQGHDFSMRGQSSFESSVVSGGAHLLSFTGSDTIPAVDWLEHFYGADCEKELIAGSVAATEHSVMCMGGKETEAETYRRLLFDVYPTGIVSIVSDTWDYWKVLTETIPSMRDKILARSGKFVVRPDSGDPVKIVCGDPEATPGSPQHKGTISLLWETFGGEVNAKGYRQLNPAVGCIYGDSITLERARDICQGLMEKGYASTNIVFGIGSYTYQYVTRDTLGFAVKATYGRVNGEPRELYKTPATDVGVKFSARGLLRVNDDLTLSEGVTQEEEETGALQTVFHNGALENEQTLAQIRTRLSDHRSAWS